jgi:ABC-type transport system involved in multi-copper enzyme maturation permease subunit
MSQEALHDADTLRAKQALDRLSLAGQRPSPSLWHSLQGVLGYELIRTFTPIRIALWLGMAFFPALLITATIYLTRMPKTGEFEYRYYLVFSALLFVLLPQVVTVLCMLLWAVPIVNAELEGQTWIYSVIRPGARRSILLGKYLVAVLWTGSCTSLSALMCTIIAWSFGVSKAFDSFLPILAINWIAAIVYGALMITLGALFQRRSMVFAFAYAAGIEAVMGWVPAVINRFTMSYRLRSLMMDWLNVDLKDSPEEVEFLWEEAMWAHLFILATATIVMLALTLWRIERSQHRFQSEY